jgi:hypothetical protein
MTIIIDGSNGTTGNLANGDLQVNGVNVGKGGGSLSVNTAVGFNVGNANTTGTFTAVGNRVLQVNTTGVSNVGFGGNDGVNEAALQYNTTGNYNTAFGVSALCRQTTGSNNTAVGTLALLNNTTASNNTAVGYQALYTNTTSSFSSAIGYRAGYTSTSGYVTALGYDAAKSATSGYSTICAVGVFALQANTTGTDNTAVGGYNTLGANTTGSYNTALGREALNSNTTASYNTALGYQAGYSYAGTVGRNTLIGYQAGYSATGAGTSTSYGNVFVGYQAGYAVNSSGSFTSIYNTFIGTGSGNLVTTGTGNTILGVYSGNQGGLDIRTASNYIVLSDGDGNPRVIVDGSGNLMVGRTSAGTSNAGGFTAFSSGLVSSERNGTVITANRFGSDGTAIELRRQDATVGSISVTASATAYNTSSDYRLKENIEPMIGALATVSALKPVTYKWKSDGSNGQGFIAHELAEVVPECVTGEKDAVDADGKPVYQGIDTSFLVATLTAAIQELKAEVDSLKQQLGK